MTARKSSEKLVIEIITVRNDYDCWILQIWLKDKTPGVEGHGKALAAALGVPHYTSAAIACLTYSIQSGMQCAVDGVKLMVSGDLLGEYSTSFILENHKL